MGLDNLWKKNDNETARVEGDFQICGGMFSDNGNTSFRGKVYHRLVEDITGICLYGYTNESDIIPNDIIKDMAESLEASEWRDSYIQEYDVEEQEFKDLAKMFRLHADAGHYLVAFY